MDEKALEAAEADMAHVMTLWSDWTPMDLARVAITAYLEASGIQKDAERYRWLRDYSDLIVFDSIRADNSQEFDAEIDEARK